VSSLARQLALLPATLAWLVAAPLVGDAQPRLAAGTAEFTLAGGFSASHELSGTDTGITGTHIIPHVGFVVTETIGPAWLPAWLHGNLELIAEPTVLHLNSAESTNFVGLTALGRWIFLAKGRVRAFVEAGPGLLTGESGLPQTDCDVNFSLQAGVGLLLFWSEQHAVTLGYRLHHLSNGSVCRGNPGLNSALFILGLSVFLP
jgi:hypothetical protein